MFRFGACAHYSRVFVHLVCDKMTARRVERPADLLAGVIRRAGAEPRILHTQSR